MAVSFLSLETGEGMTGQNQTEKKRSNPLDVFGFHLVSLLFPPLGRLSDVSKRNTTLDSDIDPAAGSPTATLLRLLLPLAAKYRSNSAHAQWLPTGCTS